jgi:hypothetical protein
LSVKLFKWRLMPLFLLVKNVNGVPELLEYCPFSINILSSGFGVLSYYMPSSDGFLFLTEPFNLLMNSSVLFLFCGFVFRGFVLPILNLEVLEFCVLLDYLNWR